MANENYIKKRLSVSYFLMPTGLKNQWCVNIPDDCNPMINQGTWPTVHSNVHWYYVNNLESHKTWLSSYALILVFNIYVCND